MTSGEFAPGVVYEEMAHGLGSGGKEMGAIFKGRVFAADQAQPDLMHQGGGLESMTRRAVRHFIRRELTQFRIDQRQQFIGGLRVTVLNRRKMRVTSVIAFLSNCPDGKANGLHRV